jgi:hypothetical protein
VRPLPRFSSTAAVLLAAAPVVVSVWGVLFAAGGLSPGATDLIAASTTLPAGVLIGLIVVGWWPFSVPPRANVIAVGGLLIFSLVAAVSGFWSLSAAESENSAILSAGYVGALALGILLAPALRRPGVCFATGITTIATIASGCALVARSFPSTTGVQFTPRLSGTLSLPNALAILALAGVFGGLGLTSHALPRYRAVGGAVVGITTLALVLTSSRSGLGLALVGIFAMQLALPAAPRMRLIGLLTLIPAVAMGFRIATWPTFTDTSKIVAAAGWGLLLATLAVALLSSLIAAMAPRLLPGANPAAARGRASRRSVLIAGGSLAMLFVGLIAKAGGPVGAVNAIRAGFTGPVGQSGVRIGIGSNLRDHWWQTAWQGFTNEPLHGWGAGTFRLLEQVTQTPAYTTGSTHNTILEVLAGTGLLGGIPFIASGIAVVVLAVKGVRCPRPGDAVGTTIVAIGAIAFLAQGLVDVDWSLAAQGVMVYAAIGAIAPDQPRATPIALPWRLSLGTVAIALTVAGLFAVPFWLSERETVRSESLLLDDPSKALALAASAHRYNPLATAPLLLEADAREALGDHAGARRSLEDAIRREPNNYEPLLAYGTYLGYSWGDPAAGRAALERAAILSGGDPSVNVVLDTLPAPSP